MPRKLCVILLAGFLLVLRAPFVLATTTRQAWDLHRLNQVRTRHGRARLHLGARLPRRAQYWADHLAARDIGTAGLADDTAGAGVCWKAGGQYYAGNSAIVGGHPSDVSMAQHSLERSRPHLINMLGRRYRWVGIGIARDRHGLILIQDFCGR